MVFITIVTGTYKPTYILGGLTLYYYLCIYGYLGNPGSQRMKGVQQQPRCIVALVGCLLMNCLEGHPRLNNVKCLKLTGWEVPRFAQQFRCFSQDQISHHIPPTSCQSSEVRDFPWCLVKSLALRPHFPRLMLFDQLSPQSLQRLGQQSDTECYDVLVFSDELLSR